MPGVFNKKRTYNKITCILALCSFSSLQSTSWLTNSYVYKEQKAAYILNNLFVSSHKKMKLPHHILIAFFLISSVFFYLLQSCKQDVKNEDEVVQVLDPESIYQLSSDWHTQNNDTIQLSQFQGKIPLVTMVFTNCGFACPRIVADLKIIEEQLPDDKEGEVLFVLVSFDTERDHPAELLDFANEMKLDENWILLHGGEEEVRELSMVLDVQYKKQPDGNFAHSNNIILLDKKGVIVTQIEGLRTNSNPIIEQIKKL